MVMTILIIQVDGHTASFIQMLLPQIGDVQNGKTSKTHAKVPNPYHNG